MNWGLTISAVGKTIQLRSGKLNIRRGCEVCTRFTESASKIFASLAAAAVVSVYGGCTKWQQDLGSMLLRRWLCFHGLTQLTQFISILSRKNRFNRCLSKRPNQFPTRNPRVRVGDTNQ